MTMQDCYMYIGVLFPLDLDGITHQLIRSNRLFARISQELQHSLARLLSQNMADMFRERKLKIF